jgi:hypothetical protein
VRRLNSVLLPTLGRPTIATCAAPRETVPADTHTVHTHVGVRVGHLRQRLVRPASCAAREVMHAAQTHAPPAVSLTQRPAAPQLQSQPAHWQYRHRPQRVHQRDCSLTEVR